MSAPPPDELRELARVAAAADRILIITGAGISADSGLPTYRGIGGLYVREQTADAVPIEVALSGEMMRDDPALCWKYIAQIENACRAAVANPGHVAIRRIETLRPGCWTLTQNVDGLHRAAGSQRLIEIHGNVQRLYCTVCAHSERRADFEGLDIPPACPRCAGLLRPDVVLFNEMLPEPAVETLHGIMAAGPQLVISVGTSSAFPYIAAPMWQAREQGVPSLEINPDITPVSDLARYRWPLRAAEALPALADALEALVRA